MHVSNLKICTYSACLLNWFSFFTMVTGKLPLFIWVQNLWKTRLTSLFLFNTCSKRVGLAGRSPMDPDLCFVTDAEPSTLSCTWQKTKKKGRSDYKLWYSDRQKIPRVKNICLLNLQSQVTAQERKSIYSRPGLFFLPPFSPARVKQWSWVSLLHCKTKQVTRAS